MLTASTTAWIAFGVVGVVIAVIAVSKLVLHSIRGPLEARIAAKYSPHEIVMQDLTANCFGLESAGVWQVRGNGALVLTETCLHFFMFLPRKEFRIPLDAITEVSLVKSHLGKATIYDLLKVRFTSDGQDDSIAWYLPNAGEWKGRIEVMTVGRQS